MESNRVIVSGLVQGVFFRDTCRRQALAAGVRGWVRNLPDGTVEAHFEGDRAAVTKMVAWALEGPPRATVTGLRVRKVPPEHCAGFDIVG